MCEKWGGASPITIILGGWRWITQKMGGVEMDNPKNGGVEMDDSKNGGVEMNLGNFFGGGVKTFSKKLAKIRENTLF